MTTNDSHTEPIQDLTDVLLDMQKHAQGTTRIQERVEGRMDRLASRMDRMEANQHRLLKEQYDYGKKADRMLTLLDGIASRITDDGVEHVGLSAQVTRHEDWIVAISPDTNEKYVPGA